MPNFELVERLEKHDKKYGEIGAELLSKVMEEEVNGYCFKYPKKKAAAMFNLNVKDFKRLVNWLAEIGALCAAGNAIVSNPHRMRFKKPLKRYHLHRYY